MLRYALAAFAILALAQASDAEEAKGSRCRNVLELADADKDKVEDCAEMANEGSSKEDIMNCIAESLGFLIDGKELNENAFVDYCIARINAYAGDDVTEKEKQKMITRLNGKCKRKLHGEAKQMLKALHCTINFGTCRRN